LNFVDICGKFEFTRLCLEHSFIRGVTSMTKNRYLIGAILVLVSLALMGCDTFFTTPWAEGRKYEAKNIKLTSGNLASWKKAAVGNPDLALELAKKIAGMDNPDKDFLNAGVGFALQAAGLGTTILSKISMVPEIIGDGDSSEELASLFEDLRNDFHDSNGKEAAEVLAGILSQNISDNQFNGGYEPSSGDAVQAIIVLTLALVGDKPINEVDSDLLEDFIDFDSTPTKAKGDRPEAKVLAAYFNFIADSDNDMANEINKAFGNN
jgi:hypothetical protein